MRIRQARTSDAEAIAAIYNREVVEGTATLDLVPRTVADQTAWIRDRSGGLAALVAENDDGLVAGFAALSFYRDRPGYRTSVEDSIYIASNEQGAGIGSLLLGHLIDTAAEHGFHAMFARIVGPQEASTTSPSSNASSEAATRHDGQPQTRLEGPDGPFVALAMNGRWRPHPTGPQGIPPEPGVPAGRPELGW